MAHEWWGYWDFIYPSLVYVTLKEFGVVGLDMYTWGIKDFHKCWSGSLAKRRLCLGPAGVINCTSLSALSLWVSLFPRTRGYNTKFWKYYRGLENSSSQESWHPSIYMWRQTQWLAFSGKDQLGAGWELGSKVLSPVEVGRACLSRWLVSRGLSWVRQGALHNLICTFRWE